MDETEVVTVPRCERVHPREDWPYTRRCEGTATETVQLTDGETLRVCALCKLDAAEGQHLDVVQDGEEE